MTRRVVLLHGLWMPRASMRWMAARLRDAGYAPSLFSYATVSGGPEAAVPAEWTSFTPLNAERALSGLPTISARLDPLCE